MDHSPEASECSSVLLQLYLGQISRSHRTLKELHVPAGTGAPWNWPGGAGHTCWVNKDTCAAMLDSFATTFLNYAKIQNEESGSDLAKVSPGDGDSVGCVGEMQPGSDVNRTTRTTGFNTRLVRGVIALYIHTQTHTNAKQFCKLSDR